MATLAPTPDDRNAILFRFIIFYVICILCALIPLYYLFNVNGEISKRISVSGVSSKKQNESLEKFLKVITNVDKRLASDKIDNDYKAMVFDLLEIARNDSIKENNVYDPLLLKIARLYEKIQFYSQIDIRTERDELKAKLKELQDKYDKLNDEKIKQDVKLEEAQKSH
jgi:hypothetical protein